MTVEPETLDRLRELPDQRAEEARATRFAERLLANPAAPAFGLTRRQAAVIQAVLDADPDEPQCAIAKRLGYGRAASFSQMLLRCRETILEAFRNEQVLDQPSATSASRTGGDK